MLTIAPSSQPVLVYRAAEAEGPLYVCPACGWTGDPATVICGHQHPMWINFAPAVLERAARAASLSEGAPVPDLTVVLVVPPQVAAERRQVRGGAAELYERDRMQARCCALYARAEELVGEGERVAVVDGTGSMDEVAERVWAAVETVVGRD